MPTQNVGSFQVTYDSPFAQHSHHDRRNRLDSSGDP